MNAISRIYTEHMGNTLSDMDLYHLRHQAGVDMALVNRILSAGYVLGAKDTTFILPPDVLALQMPTGASLGDWLKRLIEDNRREREHRHHHHHHHQEPFPVPGGGSVTGGGWR